MDDKELKYDFIFWLPLKVVFLSLAILCLAMLQGLYVSITEHTGIDFNKFRPNPGNRILDRNGEILRWIPDERGERYIWKSIEEIPEHVQKAFLAAEDRRFFSHPGVDLYALLRAVISNITEGRIVSGASTITQQLVRLHYPRKRSWTEKFWESVRAVKLESVLDKKRILELYLNGVPLGNNLVGVEAASRVYFGKTSAHLTLSEAAVLASLPKAPGTLNPYGKNQNLLFKRKKLVLQRMLKAGFIKEEGFKTAKNHAPLFKPRSFPFKAPHFVNMLISDGKKIRITKTTLDARIQRLVEKILHAHRHRLLIHGGRQTAAIILSNKTSGILSLAGSFSYSSIHLGFNNGASALRSPGSTLKPFVYAQALDKGLLASDILEDVKRSYSAPQGIFDPVNYNKKAYGPVSMREALGNSLNQSAIYLLNKVGYESSFKILKSLNLINHPEYGPDYYGLGLVLGNPEVKLIQLVAAYSALANNGIFFPPRFRLDDKEMIGKRIFSPEASFIVTDMLSDPGARNLTFGDFFNEKLPFKMAVKTGTSTYYRDAWIIGYTPDYTVGIWVGNFDGKPTTGLSGASAASPILADIMLMLHPDRNPGSFLMPEGVLRLPVCSISGMKPRKSCPHIKYEFFMSERTPEEPCSFHRSKQKLHSLPTSFAGWLHGKYQKGDSGRYRLDGFSQSLERTFNPSGNKLRVFNSRTVPEYSSRTPGYRKGVRIVNPIDGDTYVSILEQRKKQIIMKARTEIPLEKVTWYVDGEEYATVGPPYEVAWTLSKGNHTLTVTGPDHFGDTVNIFIE